MISANPSTAAEPVTVTDTLTWHPASVKPKPSLLVMLWLPRDEPRNLMPHAASGYWDPSHNRWQIIGNDGADNPESPGPDVNPYDYEQPEPLVSHWSPYPSGPDRGQAEPCV